MLSVHTMHYRLALGVSFNAKSYLPVAVHLHLIGIEALDGADLIFHPLNHVGAIRAVIGQEVDHPHGAWFTGAQIHCKALGMATIGKLG